MATRVLCVRVLVGALVLLLPLSLIAQNNEYRGQGYLFFAPGALTGSGNTQGTFHIGGGGEGFLYRGLAGGAEIGYLASWKGEGIGVLSLDSSLHFNRRAKLSPFVTGGYSLLFRSGHANGVNFGGGVNWWIGERMGIRLEFRDHFQTQFTDIHYPGFRIGFAFR